MWNKIKAWFKKDKPMGVVDRVEPTYQLPPKQRVGKSDKTKAYPRTATVPTQTYVPPAQHIDTSFQDIALTYLLLDLLADSTPSQPVERISEPEPVTAPEPVQNYSGSESSSRSYSNYDDSSSSRYSSDSSSSYSSYDSGSSDSSSSYSSD